MVTALFALTILLQHAMAADEPRALYTYSFGGIEDMDVKDAVTMLDRLGYYAGITADGRGSSNELPRLKQYINWSKSKGAVTVCSKVGVCVIICSKS